MAGAGEEEARVSMVCNQKWFIKQFAKRFIDPIYSHR
jgi:hypothetical protein